MLNSAEEHSYWYLRLNGFFLLDNFVIHKSSNVDYTSDTDILGIRTPFVFEEIGGQERDWDHFLFRNFDRESLIGVIVQVKGGAIGEKELFKQDYLQYSIQRLGLLEDVSEVMEQLNDSPTASFTNRLNQQCQFIKLLISRDEPDNSNGYLWIPLEHVYKFLIERIQRYPKEKYRDRNFFSSIGFQTLTELNHLYSKL